jgi:DegV family protein with EDD domain
MSHKIALITDSTCDIPAEWVREYDITIIPMTIIWGNEQYLDGIDLTAEAFYQRLLSDSGHPTTSQPAPSVFLDAYRQVVQNGAEEIVVVTISGAMSGTIESARIAAGEISIPVHVIDSKSNSMGLGWQVMAAARARENGADPQTILHAAKQAHDKMVYYISLDTIEYLSRGGRIGSATNFLNSLLKIKPLIYVNHETGTVGASIPSRSRPAAIDGLYKQFFRFIDTKSPMHITVLHNAALEEAQTLAERVRQEFSPRELFISIVSPTLGVHTGPRAIALCGYAES